MSEQIKYQRMCLEPVYLTFREMGRIFALGGVFLQQ